MVRLLIGFLAIWVILGLLRFLGRVLGGWFGSPQGFPPSGTESPKRPGAPFSPEPRSVPRELKRDPQCGTYVSPELSIRSQYRGEELHFCSRECEQTFFQVQSEKSH